MLLNAAADFAKFVRSYRLHANLTQAEFAQRVGMSRRWVQSLEAGILEPSLSATLQVATALGFETVLREPPQHPEIDAMFAELA